MAGMHKKYTSEQQVTLLQGLLQSVTLFSNGIYDSLEKKTH